jgi:hypothetical protein
MTEPEIIRKAMSALGKRTSERKAKSSRRNGRLAWSKKRLKPTPKNNSK